LDALNNERVLTCDLTNVTGIASARHGRTLIAFFLDPWRQCAALAQERALIDIYANRKAAKPRHSIASPGASKAA
jgi:hypothetical protein